MSEQRYISHSAEECFGKRTNKKTIKYGLGRPIGIRSEAVKQYNNSKIKWKKGLKALKKQKKIIFTITRKSGSLRETMKIKKIRSKASSNSN